MKCEVLTNLNTANLSCNIEKENDETENDDHKIPHTQHGDT